MDPSGSHTAQLDPVGVQAGHRIAQIHLGLEADSRHGSHGDPEKSLGGTSLSVPFRGLRGTQSLAGHREQQLGQHWPGCDHPLLPPWVTNPHCRSSCGTGTSPSPGPSSSPASSFASVPSLWVTLYPFKWEIGAQALLHPRTHSHPNLGGDTKGQTWVPAAAGVEHLWWRESRLIMLAFWAWFNP